MVLEILHDQEKEMEWKGLGERVKEGSKQGSGRDLSKPGGRSGVMVGWLRSVTN